MKNHYLPVSILVILTFIETLCGTYFLEFKQHMAFISIAYFISGLGIAIFPIVSAPVQLPDRAGLEKHFVLLNKILLWGFFAFISFYLVFEARLIMQSMEIDYKLSDTLPQVKAMSQRLINGEKIYAPIREIWDGKQPPYLPMMWLPYVPAEYFGFDSRWTSVAFILAGLFLSFRLLPVKLPANPILLSFTFMSLFMLLNFLLVKDRKTIGWTEEGVVIGYYLFLGFALARNSPVLIGIAIACCLLSRFSLFFWTPMFIVYVYLYESRRNAIVISSVVAAILFFVFLLPFGLKQPEYFLNIPADYHVGVDRAWASNYIDGVYYPYSLGVAKFLDIAHIKLLHNLHIITAAFVPLLAIAAFRFLRNKASLNQAFFGLCSLKLSLVFFYNLIEVPYFYLFLYPPFLVIQFYSSIWLISGIMNRSSNQ